MKKFVVFLLFSPFGIYAQDSAKHFMNVDANNQVYDRAEQMPKFNGDISAYFSEHFVYPEKAMDKGIQGTVYITFVVEKDGSITGAHAKRSIEHSIDSAASAWVSEMPKWTPGMQNGQAIRVQYDIPIRFTIPDIDQSSVNPSTPPRVK